MDKIILALLIVLIIAVVYIVAKERKENYVPRIMRRIWDRDLNPTDRYYWYWSRAHPGLRCADNCFGTPQEQRCLQWCRRNFDIPTYPSYYEMRARGLLAY